MFFLGGCTELCYHAFKSTTFKCGFNVPNSISYASEEVFKFSELPEYESGGYYDDEFPFLVHGKYISEYVGNEKVVSIPPGFVRCGI